MTIRDLKNLSEDDARTLIESVIWPNGPVCPHCGNADPARMTRIKANPAKRVRAGLVQCKECRKQTTVTRGTLMEGSHLPLRTWVYIVATLCNGRKGCSARQLWRELTEARMDGDGKVTYGNFVTIWYTCMRWREAFGTMTGTELLGGEGMPVEADTAWIGGKPRYHRKGKQKDTSKQAVHALVDRKGTARIQVLTQADAFTLRNHLIQNIDPASHLMTDEDRTYKWAGKLFAQHSTVNHSKGEYARKDDKGDYVFHNNGCESLWSLVRRSWHGTHHRYSVGHMPRYMKERAAMWTTRNMTDVDRVKLAIQHSVGKRLYYHAPKGDGLRLVSGASTAPEQEA